MAQDKSLALRQAVITHLRADIDLIALVPADRNYGERSPATLTWPFTRYGVSDALPRKAQCWDGSDIAFPIHAFSKSEFTDEVANINAAIAAALDGKTLSLEPSGKAHVRWAGSTILPDAAEANAWHGVSRFEATIA